MLVRKRARRRGVGDWFNPSCTPGEKGCVPHWYCYIPGAATPDCLESFVTGAGELADVAGSTAGRVIGGTAQNAVGGFFSGLFDPNRQCDSEDFWCNYGTWVILGAVGLFLFAPMIPAFGRRRRR